MTPRKQLINIHLIIFMLIHYKAYTFSV